MLKNDSKCTLRRDAVIVGAGPIGIETAVAFQAAMIDFQIVEAGSIGHTVSWWAPQTRWFSSNDRISIAGVPLCTIDQAKASREEYLNYLRSVVDQFGVAISTFTRVSTIKPSPDGNEWMVGLVSGHAEAGGPVQQYILTPHVILATGGTDHPNLLGVPGEDLPLVDGYLRETHRYHGRRVLIVGGRNSAVEAAIRLHRAGAKVTLSYHRESFPSDSIKYWLRPEIDGLIRSGAVEAIFDSKVVEIMPGQVKLCQVAPGQPDRMIDVVVDDVLTLIGYRQDKTLFNQLGIPLDSDAGRPVFNPETMETPVAGIYVAGTAVGGTQSSKYQIFLENCHDHPAKIARHIASQEHGVSNGSASSQAEKSEAAASLACQIEISPES
ncbi:NAD(P)-binding domain-containing protein [Rubripirellula reticaptiva]|uniref:Ferredoxin--NADP reductase 2 n=1 Tax=Rubripirellula reticaptiva TaxID=2528013 RepID=A0A5C6F6B2_9BACT|nr:NAD(P)-binding domain-containing protein [Rubripirellula reticaptiva]TWU57243.1 Ferredoxin--NADP reductase 2 [Rubripirellula reticaptiva]